MLFLHFFTSILLLTTSVTAHQTRRRREVPWGADTLSSFYSRTSTPTTTSTHAPPTITYPVPLTPLNNRRYTRTLAKSRTVETPTTPPPPLPPVRTAAPPTIEYAKGEEPRVDRPEIQVEVEVEAKEHEVEVEQDNPSTLEFQPATPEETIELTTILVYHEMRSASNSSTVSTPLGPATPPATPPTTPTDHAKPKDVRESSKPVLDRTLCKPCLDIMKSCIEKCIQTGATMDDATYKKCLRELCFFDGGCPSRCKAGGRCGDMFKCPARELMLRY